MKTAERHDGMGGPPGRARGRPGVEGGVTVGTEIGESGWK
jgi:hypothetical protein